MRARTHRALFIGSAITFAAGMVLFGASMLMMGFFNHYPLLLLGFTVGALGIYSTTIITAKYVTEP